MKAVLRQVMALPPHNSRREEYPDLYKYFEAVYTWVMTIHGQWENCVLFATNGGRLGFASDRVLEGALVCMLYAGGLLYILRQRHTQELPTVLFSVCMPSIFFRPYGR
jgi:hypothetical protein